MALIQCRSTLHCAISDTLFDAELGQQKIDGGFITQFTDGVLICKRTREPFGLAHFDSLPPFNPDDVFGMFPRFP